MAEYSINTISLPDNIERLRAGDTLKLSGIIYTARDAAHKKLFELLDAGERLPFPLAGSTIYYAGPTPGKGGSPVGSCGPTTSSRMDGFAPRLLSLGLCAMIGKGERSPEVIGAIEKYRGIYLAAIGGAGAIIAKAIKKSTVIAFPELGCESIKQMLVEDFPAYVAIDAFGGNLYRREKNEF